MDAKLIPLTKGRYATVDAADYEWLNQWTWHAFKNQAGQYYAARTVHISGSKKTRKKKSVYMHRLIVGAERGQLVDHRDGNGLNNQRGNLRVCTKAQNAMNSKRQNGSASKYKGVSPRRNKQDRPWQSTLRVDGRTVYLGAFATEEEAARAYDVAAAERFGEFAKLNFPEVISCGQTMKRG